MEIVGSAGTDEFETLATLSTEYVHAYAFTVRSGDPLVDRNTVYLDAFIDASVTALPAVRQACVGYTVAQKMGVEDPDFVVELTVEQKKQAKELQHWITAQDMRKRFNNDIRGPFLVRTETELLPEYFGYLLQAKHNDGTLPAFLRAAKI